MGTCSEKLIEIFYDNNLRIPGKGNICLNNFVNGNSHSRLSIFIIIKIDNLKYK
jgi:hypothetical protein